MNTNDIIGKCISISKVDDSIDTEIDSHEEGSCISQKSTSVVGEDSDRTALIDCRHHLASVSCVYPAGMQQSPSLPMVIQITEDEDDDSLAYPLNRNNKVLLIDQDINTITNINQDSGLATRTDITGGSVATTSTWMERYFNFMGPMSSVNNHTGSMNTTTPIYSTTAPNAKVSSKSEILYAMLVATVVALGAVFYSAWFTTTPSAVVASGANSPDDSNSGGTALSHNNTGMSCDNVHTSFTSSIEAIFTTLATGFIASIIAVTFFSKMNISLTFDSTGSRLQPIVSPSSSDTTRDSNDENKASVMKTSTKSVLEIQASLVRLFHSMIAAVIVSILTYIIMNYNHTIVGKVITALYLLFLGM
jgi:hypothetical protein